MIPGGSFDLAVLQKGNPEMEIGTFQVPAPPGLARGLGERRPPAGPTATSRVSKKSEHQEEAMELVRWMATKEFGQMVADEVKQLSAVPGVTYGDPVLGEMAKSYEANPSPYLLLTDFRYGLARRHRPARHRDPGGSSATRTRPRSAPSSTRAREVLVRADEEVIAAPVARACVASSGAPDEANAPRCSSSPPPCSSSASSSSTRWSRPSPTPSTRGRGRGRSASRDHELPGARHQGALPHRPAPRAVAQLIFFAGDDAAAEHRPVWGSPCSCTPVSAPGACSRPSTPCPTSSARSSSATCGPCCSRRPSDRSTRSSTRWVWRAGRGPGSVTRHGPVGRRARQRWQWIGFPVLLYGAALGGIPEELGEAARVDGAEPLAGLPQGDPAPPRAGHRHGERADLHLRDGGLRPAVRLRRVDGQPGALDRLRLVALLPHGLRSGATDSIGTSSALATVLSS